ncbi:MAG: UPF0280 family protein [Spirochaetales bacterium]|nr:UPF0280 family protein [Spirochaetales bacterium]
MRTFRLFRYKDASYRISLSGPGKKFSEEPDSKRIFRLLTDNIIAVRTDIENYIRSQPEFLTSLTPVRLTIEAPYAVLLMAAASELTGLGPMAAVAGTIAQCAAKLSAEVALSSGFNEIIIENGGDIYISLHGDAKLKHESAPITAGIFSGLDSAFSNLALKIPASDLPVSICSSSGRMGHSLSMGDCDLSTVISKNAALADCAATLGGNLVKTEADLGPSAERIAAIEGVSGVILIKNRRIAMAGELPQLIRHIDTAGLDKITKTVRFN